MSSSRPPDLPDFAKPPVAEVVLSLQFNSLSSLTTAHVGLLWRRFRDRLPLIEEHPPLAPAAESFAPPAPPRVEVAFEDKPPVPRVWFVNEAKTELVQVQQDRFAHNWRKVGEGDAYPRYERIRERFRREVSRFEAFLEEEGLGELAVNQCEVGQPSRSPRAPCSRLRRRAGGAAPRRRTRRISRALRPRHRRCSRTRRRATG